MRILLSLIVLSQLAVACQPKDAATQAAQTAPAVLATEQAGGAVANPVVAQPTTAVTLPETNVVLTPAAAAAASTTVPAGGAASVSVGH